MSDEKSLQVSGGTTAPALAGPASLNGPLVRPAPEVAPVKSDLKQVTSLGPSADHAKFADEVHQYVREYIRIADQKAAFFFASATALLAFLHSRQTAARWLKAPAEWSVGDAFAFVAMVGLATSAAVLLAVVVPRLKSSKRGIIYFGNIAEYETSAEYADDISRWSPPDLVRAKLQHGYELANVCRRKYLTLVVGLWIGSVGAGAALIYLLIG